MSIIPSDEKGIVNLNFRSSLLERGFRESYFNKSIRPFRIAFITVIIMYAFFGLLDKSVSGEFFQDFKIVRFYIVIPFLSGVFISSLTPIFKKIWQDLLFFSYILAGGGIIYMVARIPDNLYYYTGLFLVFIAGFFFIRLRFFRATVAAVLIIIYFNVYNYILQGGLDLTALDFYLSNSFYVATVIIGSVGSYQIESLERNEYYRKVLLIESQKEISDVNENLEQKIIERTKELTIAKDKAEESERLKSAFLTNMSHEIRTPMNGILGFADLIKEPDITPENLGKYIEIIRESSNRLLNTVNDIIDISKIETGQTDINYKEINVLKEIQSLINFFEPQAKAKGLELSLINKLEVGEEYMITDKTKFVSIVNNLINNGIKFTNKGWVNVTLFKKENTLICNVKDTGIGISKDKQKVIFNRFVQANIQNNRVYEGSGLGLSISKSYTKLLKGNLWVESIPEHGASFFVQLPFEDIEVEQDDDPELIGNELSPEELSPIDIETSILVAEDDEVSAKHMEVLMSSISKSAKIVSNGKDAVQYMKDNPNTELVLLDLKMPLMNGFDACEEILKINPNAKVIAQTAFTSNNEEERCLEHGFKAYIAKPFSHSELIELIQRIL
jgi:signal transduction histidine kinase